jgi:molybdopterin converting factor small subunit
MEVTVELLGFLADLAKGKSRFKMEIEAERPTVLTAVKVLGERFGLELERNLVESLYGEVRKAVLILLNGVEVSALSGLETPIGEGDKITFIPISSGG